MSLLLPRHAHRFAFLLLACGGSAGCYGSSATTSPTPSTSADVIAAHGYAVPKEQLAEHIAVALEECGWTLRSSTLGKDSFVAQKHALFDVAYVLTVAVTPVGDRYRVDVTSTSDHPRALEQGENRKNVWTFYDALDRRAGDATAAR